MNVTEEILAATALRNQVLTSGILVRQDFRNAVRLVYFDTDLDDWRYASYGGTAFIVRHAGRTFALTCGHVFKDFDPKQLVLTPDRIPKKGSRIAKIKGLYRPSLPEKDAVGTDITDLSVIEFDESVEASFFFGAYILEPSTTAGQSSTGDSLLVSGSLKDKSSFVGEIVSGFCLLEFQDNGQQTSDPLLRSGIGQFPNLKSANLLGLSGAPVLNTSRNVMCGMVVRGGVRSEGIYTIEYLDMFHILKFLDGISSGAKHVRY